MGTRWASYRLAAHDTLSQPHSSSVEVLETPIRPETELGVVSAELSQEHTHTARPGTFTHSIQLYLTAVVAVHSVRLPTGHLVPCVPSEVFLCCCFTCACHMISDRSTSMESSSDS